MPGTTRDAVETDVEMGGLRVRLVDTAGLRPTADAVEAEGTRRARAAAATADAVLYVADARIGLDAEERTEVERLDSAGPPVLLVATKADLLCGPPHETLAHALLVSAHGARTDAACLDALREALLEALDAGSPEGDAASVNERHRAALAEAQAAVGRAQAALAAGTDADLLALDLRDALHALGLVTGAVTADDILGAVFSRFCIGK